MRLIDTIRSLSAEVVQLRKEIDHLRYYVENEFKKFELTKLMDVIKNMVQFNWRASGMC